MNIAKQTPPLMGSIFSDGIEWVRSLPGYDALSDIGGQIINFASAGSISPQMQSQLLSFLSFTAAKTGKTSAQVTAADLEKYAAEFAAAQQKKTDMKPWIYAGAGVIGLGMLGFFSSGRRTGRR